MSTRTDKINLDFNLNGDKARETLNELNKTAFKLKESMVGLKKTSDEYLAGQLKLKNLDGEMEKLRNQIGLTALTMKDLSSKRRQLQAILSSAIPDTAEFKKYEAELVTVIARQKELRSGIDGFTKVNLNLTNIKQQLSMLAAGYLGFQFLITQFKNIVQGAGKMSDQLADLRRVTGLTADEVANLNSGLSKLDTRTSVNGLRDIAIVAGKLGVAKDDILGFTKAVDMLVVALGDELGDADQITTSLGKILNVFDGKITGDNISKLGNAIVDLANKGVATGGFIVDFTQRLSGIAKAANISLPSLLGLGAALEETGARVESSSTAISKLVTTIAQDIPKAAKIAGATSQAEIDKFADTFAKAPQEALLQFAQGLQKNKKNFAEIASSFKDAGEEGQRVVATLSILGTKTDFFRGKMKEAGDAIKDTTAIQAAFALKNENLGAELEKLGKQFYNFIYTSGLTNFLTGAVNAIGTLIKAITSIPGPLLRVVAAFASLVVAVAIYNSGMIASARASLIASAANIKNIVVLNAKAVALLATRVAHDLATRSQALAAIATELFTGKIKLAAAAQKVWNLVLKGSWGPISVIATALAGVGAVLYAITGGFKKGATAMTYYTETTKKANEEISKQQSEVDTLTALIKDKSIGDKVQQESLQKLIDISPEYLHGLTLENIATKEGKDILDKYNVALQTSANIKAAAFIKEREYGKRNELQSVKLEVETAQKSGAGFGDLSSEAQDAFSKATTSVGRTAFTSSLLNSTPSASDYSTAIAELNARIKVQDDNIVASTDNYIDQTKLKEEARRHFLNGEVQAAKKLQLSLTKGTKEYEEATIKLRTAEDNYYKEFQSAPSKSKTGTANGEDPSVAARRTELEALIKGSQTKYEKLNATDKAGQIANLALRKKYEAELDALDHKENKKSGGSKNTEYDRLRKEAQAFYESLQKLKEDAANADKTKDEKDLIALEQKYKELHAKALEYLKKNVTDRKTYTEEEKLIVETFNNELTALLKKQFDVRSGEEYAQSLKASDDYFAEKKRNVERDYAEGKIDKDDYEKSLTKIEGLAVKNRITIANGYTLNVKKAAEDVKNFTIAQEDFITKNLEHQKELREAILRDEAKAAREIKNIQIKDPATSPKQRAKIKKENATDDKNSDLNELKQNFKQAGLAFDDASVNATNEGKAIWDKFNEAIKDADQELIDSKIKALDFFTQYAEQRAGDLITALNNLDQRALKHDKAVNDAKKNNYKKQLDAKLISQKQYDKKVAEADAEMDKKKHEADLKAFKRQQALSIVTALINGAIAVTSTLAARPGMSDLDTFGISRAIQVALVIAATGTQVAAIATQAPPEAAEGNWFRKGKKHKDGGIPVEIEVDEAVMKADAMTDNKQYTVSGTPAQITSKLNSLHGGVNWATGGTLQPKFRERPASINPNMARIMEQGGVVRKMFPQQNESGNNNDELFRQMIAKQEELIAEVKNQKDRLHAVVSIKEYRETEKRYDDGKKAAGMAQ